VCCSIKFFVKIKLYHIDRNKSAILEIQAVGKLAFLFFCSELIVFSELMFFVYLNVFCLKETILVKYLNLVLLVIFSPFCYIFLKELAEMN